MKAITTLAIISLFSISIACQGQTKKETTTSKAQKSIQQIDTNKQMNLLDEQTKMFNQVFDLAGAGEDNPLRGAENYAELIEKMDLPKEQKDILREQYKVYDLSLDPAKKDSLKIMVGKMLENAIEKSQNNPD